MDSAEAKSRLHERAMSITDQQFEELSKILVEEVEQPRNIELTPFGGDGGIDIRGTYGKSFFDSRFGVQVKQYTGNVHTPDMQKFVGALTHHDFQFGCFITSSDYSEDAISLAGQQSIVLINGDRLTDIMLAHELGVTYDGFDYELDSDFWEIFQRTEDDEIVLSEEVPQADTLSVMHVCLEAIDNGLRFKPQITDYMVEHTDRDEWDQRQADYYPLAGWALGYIHKDSKGMHDGQEKRQWGLTRDGTEYLELVQSGNTTEAKDDLREHIRESAIMKRILPVLRAEGSLLREELVELVRDESQLTRGTPDRRMSSIGKWLDELPEITREKEGRKDKFVYQGSTLRDF